VRWQAVLITVVAAGSVGIAAEATARTLTLEPRTLARADAEIGAFAQDGDRVAWLSQFSHDCKNTVVVRTLKTGQQVGVPTSSSLVCSHNVSGAENVISLAGDRVVYAVTTGAGFAEFDGTFLTSALTNRRERRLCDYALLMGNKVPEAVFVAKGDGPTSLVLVSGLTVETGDRCSKLWRVDASGRAARLSKVPASTVFSVAARRFAIAYRTGGAGYRIDIRDALGHRVRAVPGKGEVIAVALSTRMVAALVRTSTEATMLRAYTAADGAINWSVRLPGRTSTSLSIAGNSIVYRNGNDIWLADLVRRNRTRIATAAAEPVGLSIEGRRVAWAENINRKGRIRAIQLP
jgi:hypothetical protein